MQLYIRLQTLNRSSLFVANPEFYTLFESGFQMPDLKTFLFPGGEIQSCPCKIPDLDVDIGQLLIEVTPSPKLTPSYLSSIDLMTQIINLLIRDFLLR
jgi:hypothetical protein